LKTDSGYSKDTGVECLVVISRYLFLPLGPHMGVDPIPKSRKPRTVVAFEDSFSLKKGDLKKTWTNPLNANYSATYPPLVPVREYQDSARLLGESC